MLKTILIIILSVTFFGVLFFIIVRNLLKSKLNDLVEEEKTVYFTFGRMNPPTIGHEKLLNVLENEILKIQPNNIIGFTGRTHGKIGNKFFSTIDYLANSAYSRLKIVFSPSSLLSSSSS